MNTLCLPCLNSLTVSNLCLCDVCVFVVRVYSCCVLCACVVCVCVMKMSRRETYFIIWCQEKNRILYLDAKLIIIPKREFNATVSFELRLEMHFSHCEIADEKCTMYKKLYKHSMPPFPTSPL